MQVAIVGAGIHGSATAYALARRGHRVTVYEQFHLGHERGSSHGNSRIVRRAYPDAYYTEIMQEGYPLWHELEKESGRKLLHECGLFYFGPADHPNINAVIHSLESLKVDHQVLGRRETARVFPDLILEDHEAGILTPEAGWAEANVALETLQSLSLSKGARFVHERVRDLSELEKKHDAVIVAAGAWITDFVRVPVLVTLQTFGYVVGVATGPVWIEEGPGSLYGFPTEPMSKGIKVGVHYKDEPFDPNKEGREPADGAIELIEDFAWKRFGFDRPRVKNAKGCLYTNTANEDFLMGRLGEKSFFVSACSGHGFKFGPWIGKTMADMVEGKKKPEDFPRFYFSNP